MLDFTEYLVCLNMKTKLLILFAVSIFVAIISFVVFIYSINLVSESPEFQGHIGGGSIDFDPGSHPDVYPSSALDLNSDLSPSYALDFTGYLQFNSIFVAGPIILGIISLAFLVPNIILRIKKIPTRKYMLIIAAGVLIFFGYGHVQNGIQSLLTLEHLDQENDLITLIAGLIAIGVGTIFIVPGIIILKKAKLRIRK